ncbi:PREDICTED: basic proline-rich protein-like isoform X2 [Nelumbo nucifera]|nr:PREDICTED: basic proline-rich protein-like isoform X2 [Nelumbo nucifera]
MFSHLGPPHRRTTAEEEERVKHPKPEDSVYYHPTLNPTGAPPPGKPPMYKSSIGPRIPLPAASSSSTASSSKPETEDDALVVPPPPPPPLPNADELGSKDGSVLPSSLPLPPPPPMPPKPAAVDLGTNLPPPPPGPPPKEKVAVQTQLPPAPPIQQPTQSPPPGTSGSMREKGQTGASNVSDIKELDKIRPVLPPPPPPPGLPPQLGNHQPKGAVSEPDASISMGNSDVPKMIPPPPPPKPQAAVPRPVLIPTLQPDVLPPGISRFPPPPPPPDVQSSLSGLGLPGRPAPPGMAIPPIPRPPFGPPPGPPPMMRPPLPPSSLPTLQEDDNGATRPSVPQKPSYVKSAASTVVKRPLAQHTPELTAMVPASVRVKRETAVPKAKPKPSLSTGAAVTHAAVVPSIPQKSELVNNLSAPKTQSIDDSYMAFLEDMKALGALDG